MLKDCEEGRIFSRVAQEKNVTRDSLEKAALRLLSRREASRQEVRVALKRHLAATPQASEGREWIEDILEECAARGYLSDERYAASRFRALRQRGNSRRKVEAALKKKGISGETLDSLFDEESPDAEAVAAARTVAKKRFGQNAERFDKELGSLARAGFSYDVARRALEAAAKEDE